MIKTELQREVNLLNSEICNLEKKLKEAAKESIDFQLKCTEKDKEIIKLKEELQKNKVCFFENKKNIQKIIEKTRGRLEEFQIGTDASQVHVKELSAFIEEIASTTEENASTISQVSSNVNSIKEMTNKLDKDSKKGLDNLNELSNKTKKIKDNSGYIKEVISFIVNINERIRLLSINALIEAAHAGNRGKGFQVVAEAIRSLTEDVSPKISKIKDNIKNIINNIDDSVDISTSTKKKFENIKIQVDETKNAITEISVAIEQQTAITQQVSNSITGKLDNLKEVSMLLDDVVEQNQLSLDVLKTL